jgi:hypothetical protein
MSLKTAQFLFARVVEFGSINKCMSYILYRTTNLINGKYYVGVSNGNNPSYKGSGTALLNAIKEYGSKNFKREVIESFDTEAEAFAREAEIVNEAFVSNRNTYNIKVGGKGGTGQLKTEEHRKRISDSIKKKYNTDSEYAQAARNGGRKPAMDVELLFEYVEHYGIRVAAEKLNLTFHQCRDRYYRAKKKMRM